MRLPGLDPLAQFTQCTTCALQGHNGIAATHVATASNKMQWYECPNHEDWEHAYEVKDPNKENLDLDDIRCALVPLEVWRATINREKEQYSMECPTKCVACGQPAPHRTFVQFSNIIVTLFYTCSKECMNAAIHEQLRRGLDCINASLPNHAAGKCNCQAVTKEP